MNLNSCEIRRLKTVCAGDMCFLFTLLLKLRNVLNIARAGRAETLFASLI